MDSQTLSSHVLHVTKTRQMGKVREANDDRTALYTPTMSDTTLQGFTKAAALSGDQIDQILGAISEGQDPVQACLDAGTSHGQFKKRCERDDQVGERATHARLEGNPELLMKARSMFHWHVFEKRSYPALKDWLMVYDPDWDKMRTQRFEVDHTVVGEIEHKLSQYTKEELETIRRLELERIHDEHPVLEIPQKSEAA